MKFFIALSITLLSFSSYAALSNNSPTTAATAAILETFSHTPNAKVRGLFAIKNDDESEVAVRYQGNDNIVRDSFFDCHFHSHGDSYEDAHCHQVTDQESDKEISRDLIFGVSELQTSLEQSLDIFQRKIGVMSDLLSVKLWQADDEIYVTLTHQAESTAVQSHFMCHVHGSHFDCHRSRNAGPQEPQF